MISPLAAILALIMGLVLGLLGGGGSILAVPILVYLLDIPSKAAIATSLLVVGTTSAVAVIAHARAGNVSYKIGVVFGIFGMIGAFLGGKVAKFIPGSVLLILFALLMLVTAVAMLRGKKQPECAPGQEEAPETETRDLPFGKIALEGIVVGGVTGLVGAGGGFLVVPALALLGGLPMRLAIGTSLLVIAMKSFAGFAGFAGHVEIDYGLAIGFTVAAVIGANIGAAIGKRLDAKKLRKIFAVFVLVMAFFVLGQQLGADALAKLAELPPVAWVTAATLLLAGGVSAAIYFTNYRAETPAIE